MKDGIIYLITYTSEDEYTLTGTLKVPLESLITFCVHKYCKCEKIKLNFVHTVYDTNEAVLDLNEKCINFVNNSEIPWQVASCVYPTVLYDKTIIAGLGAVSRHICKYRSSMLSPKESEDGLLSFRQSCLQAPNEASIWTKFCEIDLTKTVKQLLCEEKIFKIPKSLVRFENHLSKPVRIHNKFKIARNLRKESLIPKLEDCANDIVHVDMEQKNVHHDNMNNDKRTHKNRKCKSNTKKDFESKCIIKNEDLSIPHQFAEGPFMTLADLVLYPSYCLIITSIGDQIIESLLPLTYKWFTSIKSIKEVENINNILQTIDVKKVLVENMELPQIEDVSLYKSDPKRHNPKKRVFTNPEDIEEALKTIEDSMVLSLSDSDFELNLDWSIIPDGANPAAGHLPDERVVRKSQQLEKLCLAVLSMAKEGDHIVDFCSGTGHLGILIAYLLPKCTVILLENKEQSLQKAKDRVHGLGLQNVYFYQCNLDFFIGKFDIGIALHACGIASDLVLDKCLKANAKFVICPCCYGSLHATDRLTYPGSAIFKSMSIDHYLCIGHTADQTHKEHPLSERGARCMAIIDSDRARLAEEFGYKVTLSRLKPLSCTPKNNLLIGVPTLNKTHL